MRVFSSLKPLIIIICVSGVIAVSCAKQEALTAEIVTPGRDLEITQGNEIYFEGTAAGGVPPYTYAWDFSLVAPPSAEDVPGKIVFNYEGAYKVVLTVTDSTGNMNRDFVRIIVKGEVL